MQVCLSNDRSMHLPKIIAMVAGMDRWYVDSNVIVGKGETGKANVSDHLRKLFPDLEKTYKLGEKSFKAAEILSAVEKYEDGGTSCPVVYIGNHRMTANVIRDALFGDAATPRMIELDQKDCSLASVESHAGNRFVSALSYAETLNVVLPLIRSGKFAKQNDIRKRFGDGTGQKLWEHSRLDALGVPSTKYLELGKEEARQAADAGAQAEAVVDSFIANHEAKGKNRQQVLSGKSVHSLYNTARSFDPEEKDDMTQLLAGQCAASEIQCTAVLTRYFKAKQMTATPAPAVDAKAGKKVKAA